MSRDVQSDIANVLGRTEFSRREVVVTSLAAGFAMAVQPVTAQTEVRRSQEKIWTHGELGR